MSPEFVSGLVSVVVPTYNRRDLVLESLESVVAQSWRPIELIVVDDGSTDGTVEVIKAWWQALPPERTAGLALWLLCHENRGPSAARNCGLATSRGEFIQFLDSDDVLHPRKLEVQVGHLHANPDSVYVFSNNTEFLSAPDWKRARLSVQRGHLYYPHGTAGLEPVQGLYRRTTCRNLGPWCERLRAWEDVEYNSRMYMDANKISVVDGCFSAKRTHAGYRVSGTRASVYLDAVRTVATHFEAPAASDVDISEMLAALYFGVSQYAARQGDRETARKAVDAGMRYPCSWQRRLKFRTMGFFAAPIVPNWAMRNIVATLLGCARFGRRYGRHRVNGAGVR